MSAVCEKCDGTGKLRHTTPADLEPTDIGNGVTVQGMGGISTRACSCVRDLPAIDGRATWWETESIYSTVVDVPIGCEAVEVQADCEVPRNSEGRRVHRVGENVYYPALVEVFTPEKLTLHADTARALAGALVAAAEACEKADEEAPDAG